MKFTSSFFIFFILISQALTTSCFTRQDSNNFDSVEVNISNQDRKIQESIKEFRSDDGSKTEQIINKIIVWTSESEENRRLAIQELLRNVDEHKDTKTGEDYGLWNGAVLTLGELKAVEAIDILADCLSCNNLVGGFVLERFPAAYAISKIGKPAIPKLLELLSKEPEKKESNHFLVAITLLKIHQKEIVDKDEKEVLRKLMKIEKKKSVITVIQDILAEN